ncbi:MAG TPA: FAD-dependent oxidoreductase [Thermoanaerobaculia bacterium]|nr:FAD-dependent oxidoreductase [Thermoanaerobaculia bacterium]
MSGEQTLTGPDLTEGVALAEIAEGSLLLGHAGGEPVLLARRGDEVFAVGATCSHYGGPLAEGLLVEDTVRCPWHHACFSLRTGAALRAPALNPVACYRVERRGDRVVVAEKLTAAAAAPLAGGPSAVVIVGAGAAGNAAAETLRKEGYRGPITVIGGDPEAPYDRPNLSKDYLAGNAPEEWIPLHPRELYGELGIDLRLATRVTAIDAANKTVTLEDGRSLPYGALLLATGADPIHLPLPGGDLPHVHYLRTLADSRAIVAAAASAKHAVVLGASFIGLEVAASLRARKIEVTVVAPDALPLGKVMGREIGEYVRAYHEEHGVVFRLEDTAVSIEPETVKLKSGGELAADLVVIGVGVRPNVALAEAAGLQVDQGVLVDEHLQTSAPGIFAAGDIARWPDPWSGQRIRVEHWVVAERQGQTAARNMLGRRQRFDAAPFFWSQHYDVQISYVGHGQGSDETAVAGSLAGKDATVTFRSGGRITAVATIFRDRQSLEAERAMERGDGDALEKALSG